MKFRKLLGIVLPICLLTGCGGGSDAPVSDHGQPPESGGLEELHTESTPMADPSFTPYEAPELLTAEFHAAEEENGVQLDLSALSDGYVAVAARSEKRLKFQVKKDDETYNYDISSEGEPSIFPLQCGDGTYTFRVMEHVVDSKYAELYSASAEVKLKDEFQPYLRPSDYVSYDADSECVLKAKELAGECATALEVVEAVFDYICSGVTYDNAKAQTVQKGYLPDPDETLRTGKGICFDYAALAAAMLRSQGIPTRMIHGYVSPNDLYHAWNMFYTEESGWVTVDYKVTKGEWNRLDLTFSANGEDSSFVGDGGNYADVYIY